MRRYTYILIGILLLQFLFICVNTTHADDLNQAYIRFDRMKINTPTTGLICAQPTTSAIEDKLIIQFPTSFTINTDLSTWTVSTSNIPSGAQAWPGISLPTNISGKSVTFPSNDLNTSTLYCFRWTNSSAVSTGSIAQVTAILQTYTAANSLIDSMRIYSNTQSNDQVTVTATVPANSTDADVVISSSTSTSTTLREDDQIDLTVQYRSMLSSSQPFTLEAYWDEGLVSGSSGNYIDVFEYVVGSASQAYGNTIPSIDLTNRRITWSISSLPPSSYKTVTFSLKVRSSLPTTQSITSSVRARGQIASAYTPESKVDFTIQKFVIPPSPTPTITPTAVPGPTATPAPNSILSPTSTPTPTPRPSLRFNSVDIRQITQTSANIFFSTNVPVKFDLIYGESIDTLNQKIVDTSFEIRRTLQLTGLVSKTRYYFQIKATNRDGRSIVSDIFTFQTASDTSSLILNPQSTVISSKDIVLNTLNTKNIIIPPKTILSLHISVENADNIRILKAKFVDSNVLGINNIVPPPPVEQVELIETLPQLFSAKILGPEKLGLYNLELHVEDVYGGNSIVTVPYKIYVSTPLTIIDNENNRPIENAQVTILKYEDSLKRYTQLDERFGISYHTDENGQLTSALPQGRYILEARAEGYKTKKINLELGISSNAYPTIYLKPTYSLSETVQYFTNSSAVVKRFVLQTCRNYFVSKIARNISAGISLLMTLILIILSLRKIESPSLLRRTPAFYFIESLLLYMAINFALVTIVLSFGFLYIQGFQATLPLLTISTVILSLVLYYVMKVKRELFS